MNTHTDNTLFEAFLNRPSLPFYSIVRQNNEELLQQRDVFLKTKKSPIFSYTRAKKIDVENHIQTIKTFENDIDHYDANPIIKSLYKEKANELLTRIMIVKAIQEQNDQVVTELSQDLFGTPIESAEKLHKEFETLLEKTTPSEEKEKSVDTEHFIKMTTEVLRHYNIENAWHIKTHTSSSITIKHGGPSETAFIYIPASLKISKRRAAKLLTHEIEVHALRTENGKKTGINLLARGLDRYLPTEEGLAIYFQQKALSENTNMTAGFWDAWTTALALKHNFSETFEKIADARSRLAEKRGKPNAKEIGEDAAWRLCIRAYRGISNTNTQGVCFARDHVYRSGLRLIEAAIETHGEKILETLFVGNIGLHHLAEIEPLKLQSPQMPEIVSEKIVEELAEK